MDLSHLFSARSIAIIGVSRDPRKVGYLIAKNMVKQGYQGDMFFVNYKAKDKILGHKIYQSLTEISGPINLVILSVPAPVCLEVLEEAGKKGIRAALIISGGFRESGEQGASYEVSIREIARKYEITLLGPNCIGFVNTKKSINATFLKDTVPEGHIGLISQSGALTAYCVDDMLHKQMGFSQIITIGNKTVLTETETIDWLAEDDNTKVIGMYLEDVIDGKKLMVSLRRALIRKPVIILKAGKTEQGAHAAASHTGSMASAYDVFAAAVSQTGAIVATKLSHFMALLQVCSYGVLPHSSKIAVVTNAGGLGVLMTDAIVQEHMEMDVFSNHLTKKVEKALQKPTVSVHNPLDLLGDASADDLEHAVTSLAEDTSIGACVCMLTPQANTEIEKSAKVLTVLQGKVHFPIYPVFLGDASMSVVEPLFSKYHLLRWKHIDGLIYSIAAYREYEARKALIPKRENNELETITSRLEKFIKTDTIFRQSSPKSLDISRMDMSLQTLHSYGISVVETRFIKSEKDVHSLTSWYPVVAKVSSTITTHKTDIGGVTLNIQSKEHLEKVIQQYKKIPGFIGTSVQPMEKGYELIVGAKRDKTFGTVIVLGVGGIFTELFHDVERFIFPISFEMFSRIFMQSKLQALAKGFRGKKPLNLQKVYNIAQSLTTFFEDDQAVQEVDINPLMVDGEKMIAVDARIIK